MSKIDARDALTRPVTSRIMMLESPEALDQFKKLAPFTEMAEIRDDKLGMHLPSVMKALETITRTTGTIYTNRLASEGGGWMGDDNIRLYGFRRALEIADAVDVEMASPIAPSVISAARSAGKISIASYHDFKGTPHVQILENIYDYGLRLGADFVKIATTTNNALQKDRIIEFSSLTDHTAIVSSMGDLGVETRCILALFGTPAMYIRPAGIGEGVPGQMDHETADLFYTATGLHDLTT